MALSETVSYHYSEKYPFVVSSLVMCIYTYVLLWGPSYPFFFNQCQHFRRAQEFYKALADHNSVTVRRLAAGLDGRTQIEEKRGDPLYVIKETRPNQESISATQSYRALSLTLAVHITPRAHRQVTDARLGAFAGRLRVRHPRLLWAIIHTLETFTSFLYISASFRPIYAYKGSTCRS